MPLEFTPALAIALENARCLAARAGQTSVEPTHLYLALVAEVEGRAAQALIAAGLDVDQLEAHLDPNPVEPGSLPDVEAVLLGSRCQAILDDARELARDTSDDHAITSDLALLALLRNELDLRARLVARGLSFERLQDAVAVKRAPLTLDEPLLLDETADGAAGRRVIDAAANRAREALRTVEDYCRFVLDDAFLSRELKSLRHELTAALAGFSATGLLEARDTPGDVGTGLTTAGEQRRDSLIEVVQAALKRLEEALRSLEEFGKLQGPEVGVALEKLRYRAYTLEKAIVLGTAARQRLADARLYVLLTGSQCLGALDWTIGEAAAGGAQIFQLREKQLADRELLERARNVRRWTRASQTLFIVNDRPDIARLADADGVHLGQDDMPVRDARRILPPDRLVGVSTHNLDQVRQAVRDGASYIGVGPAFHSETKSFPELAGLDFVREASRETTLPAFVLGGVRLDNIPAAIAAGARRVAVSQSICQAEDPRSMAAQIRGALAP